MEDKRKDLVALEASAQRAVRVVVSSKELLDAHPEAILVIADDILQLDNIKGYS